MLGDYLSAYQGLYGRFLYNIRAASRKLIVFFRIKTVGDLNV